MVEHVYRRAAAATGIDAVVVATDDDEPSTAPGGAGDVGGGAAGAEVVQVALAEFSISPDPVVVAEGGSIEVVNGGATIHNLAVKGSASRTTPDLAAGAEGRLDVSDLTAGA